MENTWAENFKWDSEDQRKSFLAAAFWLKSKGLDISTFPIRPLDVFMFQKDHESHEWYMEFLGSQLKKMEMQIAAVRNENAALKDVIFKLFDTTELNQKNVETILKMIGEAKDAAARRSSTATP